MKILQINACFGFLSTGIIAKDIDELVKKNGGTSFNAYQQGEKTENGYIIGNRLDRAFHGLHTRIFGKQGYASKFATRRPLKWIDKIKPDIIHLHNLHSNYVCFNMLFDYIAKKNIKTVYTFHDCWAFTGKCSHYEAIGCEKWKTTCGSCPQNKKEVSSLFFDKTQKVLADRTSHINKVSDLTIISCSNWMKKQVEMSLLKPKRIKTIYNGIDTEIFCPHESTFKKDNGLDGKFLILGFANKWSLEKNREGVRLLIDNLKADEHILIVGATEEQKKFFSKFDKVTAIGFIKDRAKLSDIYSSCDVFLNITHEDTLPTVNMESLCSGTPVITFDSCGSPELVSEENGYVVQKGNFEEVIECIKKLRENPKKIDIKKAKEQFDREKCFKEYIALYDEIIEGDK